MILIVIFVGDYSDLDDDNDGIYDSLECKNTSSILISGDVDTLVTSGYQVLQNIQEFWSGSGSGSLVIISMCLCLSLRVIYTKTVILSLS